MSPPSRVVLLATHNACKVAELRRILAAHEGLTDAEVRSARDIDLPEVDETGTTFAANAALKAQAAAGHTGIPSVADDSGLVVEALGGEPGVRSARYAGEHGDDDANLRLVLERMAGVEDRSAAFVCAAALAVDADSSVVVHGELRGWLTEEPRGTGGFGYDPIFVPEGEQRTTAEMAPQEKDALSHRGRAFRELAPRIVEALTS